LTPFDAIALLQSVMMRDTIKIVMLQTGDSFVSDANAVGANLLVISNHHHFFGNVKQKEAFNA
jgi:hypothetical protein